jgi:Pathogenicity locus
MKRRSELLKEFQVIPGVGPSIAQDFVDLGYSNIKQLRGKKPEKIYQNLCRLRGAHVDRCVLYVFRCAVYYTSRSTHKPELLKWWNWSDNKQPKDFA